MATNTNNAEPTAGPGVTPSAPVVAPAFKFKAVWEAAIRRSATGGGSDAGQIIEMREAFLGLIWATGTTNVAEALEVLRGLERDPGQLQPER